MLAPKLCAADSKASSKKCLQNLGSVLLAGRTYVGPCNGLPNHRRACSQTSAKGISGSTKLVIVIRGFTPSYTQKEFHCSPVILDIRTVYEYENYVYICRCIYLYIYIHIQTQTHFFQFLRPLATTTKSRGDVLGFGSLSDWIPPKT